MGIVLTITVLRLFALRIVALIHVNERYRDQLLSYEQDNPILSKETFQVMLGPSLRTREHLSEVK